FANGTPDVIDDCWGITSYDGKPDGVIVDVSKDAPLLFMRAFQAAGFHVGAHAKVCVGSPQLADSLLPFGIPVNTSECFENGVPQFGADCTITLRVPEGESGEGQYLKLYDSPSDDPADWTRLCSDQNAHISNTDLETQVARGAHTWCAVAPPGTPGNDCDASGAPVGYCVVSLTGNRAKPVMSGLQTRLLGEGECNDLYGPDFGTSADGIDEWWEALCAQGVGCGDELLSIEPGPTVTFVKRDCTAPRLVTVVLLDQFPAGGNCTGQHPCAIRGFAGFFIEGCHDDDGAFDPHCLTKKEGGPLSNTGHIFMTGTFINYVDIGGPGGPATPYGRMQLYLVE
ncbi:MAG TPA: hypothetical protein VM013_05055, partial [Dehalococcoidia bacterium]|nr:hypothetical protein [Dehalococcoidia bacterium]